jgi:hypothetical protein
MMRATVVAVVVWFIRWAGGNAKCALHKAHNNYLISGTIQKWIYGHLGFSPLDHRQKYLPSLLR